MIALSRNPQLETGKFGFMSKVSYSISSNERSTHTYVVGITGKGKSKLLEYLLYQDIINGRGCGVLDPHSDLIRDLLHLLESNAGRATKQLERIVYFDPTDQERLVPFNVLKSGF